MFLAVRVPISQATPVRRADASCEHCHREIYRSYLRTPMANASGSAEGRLIPGIFDHKSSGMEYTLANTRGIPTLSYRNLRNPDMSGQFSLSYSLGSGHLGVTWLYSLNGYLFESPVAWYAATKSFDMKPGLENVREMPPSLPMQSECLRCHMSAVQPSDSGTINRYSGLPFLHTGITCESCHGDTAEHAQSGGKAAVVNPVRLQPALRDSICISCHLEGDVTVQRAGNSVLNYRPGQPISRYLAYYVYAKNNLTARGVSEVEQLSQSTCKRMSGDRMSCMSCHDPHFTPGPRQRVAFYRAKCLVCHTDAGFAKSHYPKNPDCTSCHMPHNNAQNIPHVAWTDHRILRRPDSAADEQETDANRELVPVFSPGATKRDLGMAYYLALFDGNNGAEPKARALLQSQKTEIESDKAALDALGILSLERGDYSTAESCFRRVLSMDASDLTALSDMGTLLAKQGNLTGSVAMLRKAFERNRDIAGLATNLARVECMTGNVSEFRDTLRSALIYNSTAKDLRQMMDHSGECRISGGKAAGQ